jgi:hypothetical protein
MAPNPRSVTLQSTGVDVADDADAPVESMVGKRRVRPVEPRLARLAGSNVKKHEKLWRTYGFDEEERA